MSDKKIDSTDLAKAMAALQDLAKGHGSTGTATTKVETMVGESGPSQLFHTASNSDPGGWAGSSWRGEGWEDSISSNGTDMDSVRKMAKSIAQGIMGKLTKGEALSARETNFVAKGGLNFLNAKDDDDKKDDKKDIGKSHADAAEDKKQIKEMVKPDAMKPDVQKSLLDNVVENAATKPGFEVSEFLSGFVQVMHKSMQAMEARITDRVVTAVVKGAADDAESTNALAKSLASLGEVLTLHAQRLEQIEGGAARGPKSQTISKAGPGPLDGGNGGEVLSKAIVSERLLDLVKKSEATPQDVLRYDATGQLSPELMRKVASR